MLSYKRIFLINCYTAPLKEWSPTFSAPGTGFVEDNFSRDHCGLWGWFQDDSSTLNLLCTLFLLLLNQLHLRSSGIRSQRLGTPDLYTMTFWRMTGGTVNNSAWPIKQIFTINTIRFLILWPPDAKIRLTGR